MSRDFSMKTTGSAFKMSTSTEKYGFSGKALCGTLAPASRQWLYRVRVCR